MNKSLCRGRNYGIISHGVKIHTQNDHRCPLAVKVETISAEEKQEANKNGYYFHETIT